jgi:hypothetical protein
MKGLELSAKHSQVFSGLKISLGTLSKASFMAFYGR